MSKMLRTNRSLHGNVANAASAILLTLTLGVAATACSSDNGTDADTQFSDVADGDVDMSEATQALTSTLRDAGLSSLATAVAAIDIDRLIDSDEFTFLAPSDEAFQSMSADDMADLLANPQRLTDVLRNHVITEKLTAEQMAERTSVATEAGADLDIVDEGGALTVGGATLSTTDIETDNGIIHVVDRILN